MSATSTWIASEQKPTNYLVHNIKILVGISKHMEKSWKRMKFSLHQNQSEATIVMKFIKAQNPSIRHFELIYQKEQFL